MGLSLQDISSVSMLFGVIFGLLSALAPFATLVIKSLGEFHFGRPHLFSTPAAVVALFVFVFAIGYRNSLHHWPASWQLLLCSVLTIGVMIVLDIIYARTPRKSWRSISLLFSGFLVYVLAAALLSAALARFSTRHFIFRQVYGSVSNTNGHPLDRIPVFCTNDSAVLKAVTNADGDYEFLLTPRETELVTELRVGKNERLTDNFVIVSWDDTSFPYEIDFRWSR